MRVHRYRSSGQGRGFSLIEVMVAMTLLALVITSLARMTTVIAVRARSNDQVAKRLAVMQLEANKFGAMRYDSLATFPTTTKTFTWGGFTYTRGLRITNPGSNRYDVNIVITPSLTTVGADSILVERTKPPTNSPLCVSC